MHTRTHTPHIHTPTHTPVVLTQTHPVAETQPRSRGQHPCATCSSSND